MFMNLHTLKPNESMYTIFVSDQEPGPDAYYEEIDVIARNSASKDEVLEAARVALNGYEGVPVVGVSNQSDGYWVWREEGWR